MSGPPGYQLSTREIFFRTPAKLITHALQNDRKENTTTPLFDFWAIGSRFGEIAPF